MFSGFAMNRGLGVVSPCTRVPTSRRPLPRSPVPPYAVIIYPDAASVIAAAPTVLASWRTPWPHRSLQYRPASHRTTHRLVRISARSGNGGNHTAGSALLGSYCLQISGRYGLKPPAWLEIALHAFWP